MRRRILIIANPAAGRTRRSENRLQRVVEALERHDCLVVVRHTQAAGDAARLARLAEPEFELIVAAGGDGTVNEIVNGLGQKPRALAVLPLGTGNVLANEIGMPSSPEGLARVIAKAPACPIWPGIAGGRRFVAMIGIGFDAAVLGALSARLKGRTGRLAFVWAILLSLVRHQQRQFVVETAQGRQHAAAVVVLKGRRYAGNFVVAPDARLAEPMLYVLLFRRGSRLAALCAVAAMILGALRYLPGVSLVAVPSLTIAAADKRPAGPQPVQIDGEVAGELPLTVGIAETPLLLVQPEA